MGVKFDGLDASTLRSVLGLPRVELFQVAGSTLDVAHELAASGAPAGTLIVADAQTAGRGRMGRRWQSEAGRGIWLTLIERPQDPDALDVLSLRAGIAAAEALDAFAPAPISLKWPNDLYVGTGKLAGVLVEARWRGDRLDWLALGFGLNMHPPNEESGAAGLGVGTGRVEVLQRLVPALRGAAERRGALGAEEMAAFARRDLAKGRTCEQPDRGTVVGIDRGGALVLDTVAGRRSFRTGSLVISGA